MSPTEAEARCSALLEEYRAVRERWRGDHAPHPDPSVAGGELADALDLVLAEAARPWSDSIAILAVGGYGRRELTAYTDVDLVILHAGDLPEEAVRRTLYPLWDANIRVGHASLSPREATALARERLESLCSLLTRRLVTGPSGLADELTQRLRRLLRQERSTLESLLAAEELAVWQEEPFRRQDLNLKTGRGALRSLHRLDWDRYRSELMSQPAALPGGPEEEEARRILLSVRTALHAVRGRAADDFAWDLRDSVGRWLGLDPFEATRSLLLAVRRVDALASMRWGRVRPSGTDPVDAAGRVALRWIRDRWSSGAEPASMEALDVARRATSTFDGHLSVEDRESVGRRVDGTWTSGDRKALLEVLAAGRSGWTAFAGLWEAGWVDRALPELSHLAGLPQLAPFHTHPGDVHLGRTVVEAVDLAAGADAWLAGLGDELGSLDELLLAAWLHDAGKGLGGDHSLTGSALAQRLLTRLGFSSGTVGLVAKAVRHHLLLSQYAMRADPTDPQVVSTVTDVVGDSHTLALLAVLAAADARATGPDAWNPWRRELLRRLVGRVGQQLAGASPGALEREWRRRLEDLLDGVAEPGQVQAHLEGMPAGYLLRVGPELAARHLRLITPSPGGGESRSMIEPTNEVSTVIVAAADRPGLLSTITGVLTLHNFSVLEARVATRSDGMAIDTFRVVDVLGTGDVEESRWQALRQDMDAALNGDLEVRSLLAAKEATYPPASTRSAVSAEVWEDGALLMLEVHAPDRLGLLHSVTEALARHGVGVQLAKIETRAGEAVDTFTLHPPSSPVTREELVAVVRRVAEGVSL